MATAKSDTGYLLHLRPYQDSSVLGDFLLREHGRMTLLFKGIKKAGKAGQKGRLLQPFTPLYITFAGDHELKTGRQIEAAGAVISLQGKQLFCGLYMNELLARTIVHQEPCPQLLGMYECSLGALSNGSLEPVLREFEYHLLAELGYQIDFTLDSLGEPIRVQDHYLYVPDEGFVLISALIHPAKTVSNARFRGQELLAIAQGCYDDAEVLRAAKRLSRLALSPHLGNKPLKSRELFQ